MKSEIASIVVLGMAYLSTLFGVTYPNGFEFVALIIVIPILAAAGSRMKSIGLDRFFHALVNGSYAKIVAMIIFLFAINFFVGIASTKSTKVIDATYYVRDKEFNYIEVNEMAYKACLRADFRFFTGHFLSLIVLGVVFKKQAEEILAD